MRDKSRQARPLQPQEVLEGTNTYYNVNEYIQYKLISIIQTLSLLGGFAYWLPTSDMAVYHCHIWSTLGPPADAAVGPGAARRGALGARTVRATAAPGPGGGGGEGEG